MPDQPLHIFLSDPHVQGGGQVRYVATLAEGLVKRGHRVTIACRPGSLLERRAATVPCDALPRFSFRGGLRPLHWKRDIREAYTFFRHHRPQIIHVNGSQDHWTCAVANSLLGHPICLVRTRHNTYPVSSNPPNRVLNRSMTDFQLVVCRSVCRDLSVHPCFAPERLRTIHNGVDPGLLSPSLKARHAARLEFGFDEGHIVCAIIARLVPAKGHEFLFKAAAALYPRFPALRILVLGQGVLEVDLRLLAARLGIHDIVSFAGFREDIPFCLQAVDIGIQPSVDCDTSSFSMKELMAAQIPVIASDYGGLIEIIADGVEGFIVPAGTVGPLADALARLLSDGVLRETMGRRGRERVEQEFSSTLFVDSTIAAYYDALTFQSRRRDKARI